MSMKILVVNAGSSSLKYQLFDMDEEEVKAKGLCERIGYGGRITHKRFDGKNYSEDIDLPNHKAALEMVIKLLISEEYGVISGVEELSAVGHRVVHGGEKFKSSVIIDDEAIKFMEEMVPLNPLHGPPSIAGIKACLKVMPDKPQVGVFDTSFYSNMENYRYVYALPYELYEKDGIRKYGFHGTSHRYVSEKVAEVMGKRYDELKTIVCHLGNGSSITAVSNGVAIDTSMGFTPQGGILMGTRSGTIDPTIITHLMEKKGYTAKQVEDIINKKSGFLGVSGISNDCRNVTIESKKGNKRAELAIKMLVNSIKKYIGAYTAEMNGIDALVFTAGIGENQHEIRRDVCADMSYLGVEIDEEKNENFKRGVPFEITKEGARVRTWIIPTDEEYMIALDTQRLVTAKN